MPDESNPVTPSADRMGPEAGARAERIRNLCPGCKDGVPLIDGRHQWADGSGSERHIDTDWVQAALKQAELAAASAIEFLLSRIQTHTCIECSLGHSERRKVGEQHEHGYHDALSEQWVFKGRCMSQVEWCRERIRELEAASTSKEERNG